MSLFNSALKVLLSHGTICKLACPKGKPAVQKWWPRSSDAHVGYQRAPGMSSSFVSLTHFLYRNQEYPAKTARLCRRSFNNKPELSTHIVCHRALNFARCLDPPSRWNFHAGWSRIMLMHVPKVLQRIWIYPHLIFHFYSPVLFIPVWEKHLKYQEYQEYRRLTFSVRLTRSWAKRKEHVCNLS